MQVKPNIWSLAYTKPSGMSMDSKADSGFMFAKLPQH